MNTNTSTPTETTEVTAIESKAQALQLLADMKKRIDALRDDAERLIEWANDIEIDDNDDPAELTLAKQGRLVARLDYIETYLGKVDTEIDLATNFDLGRG